MFPQLYFNGVTHCHAYQCHDMKYYFNLIVVFLLHIYIHPSVFMSVHKKDMTVIFTVVTVVVEQFLKSYLSQLYTINKILKTLIEYYNGSIFPQLYFNCIIHCHAYQCDDMKYYFNGSVNLIVVAFICRYFYICLRT